MHYLLINICRKHFKLTQLPEVEDEVPDKIAIVRTQET